MLTQSKQQIAWAAYDSAKRAMHNHVAVGVSTSPNSMMGMMTELIALAVQAGIEEVLKNQYTDEEFEQDLGLKL